MLGVTIRMEGARAPMLTNQGAGSLRPNKSGRKELSPEKTEIRELVSTPPPPPIFSLEEYISDVCEIV